MPTGRFFVGNLALSPGAEIELPPEVAHRARDVLRLTAGNTLCLMDGVGGVYPSELIEVSRNRIVVRLGERGVPDGVESRLRIVLCQGMLKSARYEIALEKCTELGVVEFVPLLCQRAVAATDEASDSKRRRWARIIAEAMEQSGGTCLPELALPQTLPQALSQLPSTGIGLIPWEQEETTSLGDALRQALSGRTLMEITEVRLFIGPEGGFTEDEVALAQRHAAIPVTLGRRILRAETAAIAVVARVQELLGVSGP